MTLLHRELCGKRLSHSSTQSLLTLTRVVILTVLLANTTASARCLIFIFVCLVCAHLLPLRRRSCSRLCSATSAVPCLINSYFCCLVSSPSSFTIVSSHLPTCFVCACTRVVDTEEWWPSLLTATRTTHERARSCRRFALPTQTSTVFHVVNHRFMWLRQLMTRPRTQPTYVY